MTHRIKPYRRGDRPDIINANPAKTAARKFHEHVEATGSWGKTQWRELWSTYVRDIDPDAELDLRK